MLKSDFLGPISSDARVMKTFIETFQFIFGVDAGIICFCGGECREAVKSVGSGGCVTE